MVVILYSGRSSDGGREEKGRIPSPSPFQTNTQIDLSFIHPVAYDTHVLADVAP